MKITTLLLFLAAATASGETTEEMTSACKSVANARMSEEGLYLPDDLASGKCWGAFGVIQKVINVIPRDAREPIPFFKVCAPPESTRMQLAAIFVEHARRNPNRIHEDFFFFAMESLRQAFPCK